MKAIELLGHIDPAALSYDEWLAVGMALHYEGASAADWDAWSRRDSTRYRQGECARKWAGFHGSSKPVTAGTLIELARRQGWTPPKRDEGRIYSWEDVTPIPVVDLDWVEDVELEPPGDSWSPVVDITTYLSTLFEAHEYVGYVTESYVGEDGRHLPRKGSYTRTAGELLEELAHCDGDLGRVFGDADPKAGAWIRFNPLDGQGVKDSNVTSFRFALIESDRLDVERQAAIYRELELPIAALVHSGGRSLHAIVRIDATSREEYRERVNFLHEVCNKNGLDVDGANKNPSRLSRMPGFMRNGARQYLVAVNQGRPSWVAWRAWIDEADDNMPDIECLASVYTNLPPLAPALIEGVLRQGHKMLVAGPSKAGKSFLLLQLVAAIAEGREWLGWRCAQGKVLYVNLELDRASCLHRLRALYEAAGWPPLYIRNIDIWHLRGKAVPMDQLAPKLIRRALKNRYLAVVIDPIYKVLTGDENAADKMAHFCNQFDRVCHELGAAVIYCHHHSKGSQGQKSARDRSSGSGVFARDPDAILDIIELIVTEHARKQRLNHVVCEALAATLDQRVPSWRERISQDDALVAAKLLPFAREVLGAAADRVTAGPIDRAKSATAWRVEGTLREFAPFAPRRFWFEMPLHRIDTSGVLDDAKADGEAPPWEAKKKPKQEEAKTRRQERQDAVGVAFQSLSENNQPVTLAAIAENLGVTERTAREYIHQHPHLECRAGLVIWKKGKENNTHEAHD
jgi:RecA-family ATPase